MLEKQVQEKANNPSDDGNLNENKVDTPEKKKPKLDKPREKFQ